MVAVIPTAPPCSNRRPSVTHSSSIIVGESRRGAYDVTKHDPRTWYARAVGMEPAAGNTCDQMWRSYNYYYGVVEVLTLGACGGVRGPSAALGLRAMSTISWRRRQDIGAGDHADRPRCDTLRVFI